MNFTMFKLEKNNLTIQTKNLWLVKLLQKAGWKIKISELGELL